jgi:hypothetical protein
VGAALSLLLVAALSPSGEEAAETWGKNPVNIAAAPYRMLSYAVHCFRGGASTLPVTSQDRIGDCMIASAVWTAIIKRSESADDGEPSEERPPGWT